jgi:predicted RNA methylase
MSKRAATMAKRAVRHQEGAARALDGFVRTPPALAEQLVSGHVDMGALPRGAVVLEPSAGDGALVRHILDTDSDAHVVAVEPNGPRADALDALAAQHPGRVEVHRCTFEDFAASRPAGYLVDAVIANPPFGNSTADHLWMTHTRAAWDMLPPGGQLRTVVPGSYKSNGRNEHRAFREWATAQGARYEQLPMDAFKASGTTVNAGILTVPKPMPARPDGLPSWLMAPARGVAVPMPGRPCLTGRYAVAAPVQEYDDRNDGEHPRVLRYAGTCHGCARLVWLHDDGNDAATWEACTIDAAEHGMTGPSVLFCLNCYHQPADKHPAALADVAAYWTDAPAQDAEPAGPPTYPMDLLAGSWATVAGIDYRGWDFTITGRLMADPAYDTAAPWYGREWMSGAPGGDWYTCPCGNDPEGAGFDPVPGDPWDGRTYACQDCGRRFDQTTGDVTQGPERVAVKLRTARGLDVTLYALPCSRVIWRDVPSDVIPVHAPAASVAPAPAVVPVEPAPVEDGSAWLDVIQLALPV